MASFTYAYLSAEQARDITEAQPWHVLERSPTDTRRELHNRFKLVAYEADILSVGR